MRFFKFKNQAIIIYFDIPLAGSVLFDASLSNNKWSLLVEVSREVYYSYLFFSTSFFRYSLYSSHSATSPARLSHNSPSASTLSSHHSTPQDRHGPCFNRAVQIRSTSYAKLTSSKIWNCHERKEARSLQLSTITQLSVRGAAMLSRTSASQSR